MKKIFILFFVILSIGIFSEEYRPYLKKNINNKNLVFSAKIESSKKIISIYQENKNPIYVYGLEGKKAEKIIVGTANKNLFKYDNEIPLNENNNDEKIVFNRRLEQTMIFDSLFDTEIFEKIPYDNGTVGHYINYD